MRIVIVQKIACSFSVWNVDHLNTDRYYYKKPKSTDAIFAKIFFIIKILVYAELLQIFKAGKLQ